MVFAYLEKMSDFTKNVEILERFLCFLDVISPHHFLFQIKNFEFFSKSRYVDISFAILLRSCYSQLLKSQKKLRTNQNKTCLQIYYKKNCLAQIQGSKITFLDKKCSHQTFSQG